MPGLTAGETIVLDYIRANPGCTADEIAAAAGYTRGTIQKMIGDIRKTTTITTTDGGRSGPAHYTAK